MVLTGSDFGTCYCFNFLTSVFLAKWFTVCFLLFWRCEFDFKSFIIELILWIPIAPFHTKCLLKDLQLVANKRVRTFPSQLGILKDTFERILQHTFELVFQTFLLLVADFFDEGLFVLFLLLILRKLCRMLQFHFFEKRNLFPWSDVLIYPATQNFVWVVTKE